MPAAYRVLRAFFIFFPNRVKIGRKKYNQVNKLNSGAVNTRVNWMRAKLLLGFLVVVIALSCNLPVTRTINRSKESTQKTLSVEQTLIAELFPESPQETPALSHPQPDLEHTFAGLATAVPGQAAGLPEQGQTDRPWVYITQPGDTLPALAKRFGVSQEEITALETVEGGLLPVGQQLIIPNVLEDTEFYPGALLPDSAVIYSPSAKDFDIEQYIAEAGGYLSRHVEQVDGKEMSGAEIVRRVAVENSINPKLLLAVLDYRSGWVHENRSERRETLYPLGFYAPTHQGLYGELLLVCRQLTIAYYGWRDGRVTDLMFNDQTAVRLDPRLNAGSVAVQNLFSKFYPEAQWREVLYGEDNFALYYQSQFGDPWPRAAAVEPLFPEGLQPPDLELPFLPGENWSLTGGPHAAWGVGSAWGGVDFAPIEAQKGCYVAQSWATAAASGLVVRSQDGVVAVDLDGDGYEQTGWVLVYLHIAAAERVPVGQYVHVDDRIGHPSCEGGVSTGTHVHLARKYNGEWIAAGNALPYVLSGWRVIPGEKPYLGTLVRDGVAVSARSDGSRSSLITR